MAKKQSLIQLAATGDEKQVLTALASAPELVLRRAIRIAKRKGELAALVTLKKVLTKIVTTEITEVDDSKAAVIYKVTRTAQVDVEYFNAVCDFANAKKGRLITATNYTSYYGFAEKSAGTKFADEARNQIEKTPQLRGITIELDKDKIGNAISSGKPAAPKK